MFLGVDAVIVNKTDACGLTPVVSKVSSGALEFLPIYSVKFVSKFLETVPSDFKIISTNVDEESAEDKQADEKPAESMSAPTDPNSPSPFKEVIPLNDLHLTRIDNILLILGSEGLGVSRAINKAATHRVIIPPTLTPSSIG